MSKKFRTGAPTRLLRHRADSLRRAAFCLMIFRLEDFIRLQVLDPPFDMSEFRKSCYLSVLFKNPHFLLSAMLRKLPCVPRGLADARKTAKRVDLIELRDVPGTRCGNCEYYARIDADIGYCHNVDVELTVRPSWCCNLWARPGNPNVSGLLKTCRRT